MPTNTSSTDPGASGRGIDPVVCPKRQTTGYFPTPIRAKTDLSATEFTEVEKPELLQY
ncbi:MAG: hypothetical protein HY774_07920 [Acidobacteria bacterium]|nr:hypothetical protein [Acidobacteriota bacterium]